MAVPMAIGMVDALVPMAIGTNTSRQLSGDSNTVPVRSDSYRNRLRVQDQSESESESESENARALLSLFLLLWLQFIYYIHGQQTLSILEAAEILRKGFLSIRIKDLALLSLPELMIGKYSCPQLISNMSKPGRLNLTLKKMKSKKYIQNLSKYPDIIKRLREMYCVVLNLAEGSRRFSKRERGNFFIISRSRVGSTPFYYRKYFFQF